MASKYRNAYKNDSGDNEKSKNKNIILETHSELFILQIQKLIQKGILKREDVSINYILRTSKGNSEVHYIPLNSQGVLKNHGQVVSLTKEWRFNFLMPLLAYKKKMKFLITLKI